ncbi:MAG: hypothetical protein JO040_00345 [Gemmatimonadetes bacterium]|nr:hypothetical protein [Gemmatimonadota bacterium]
MMRFLRRLRGIASTSLLWAVAWGLVGAPAYGVLEVYRNFQYGLPFSSDALLPHMVIGAVFLALYGFLSGGAFSTVLALVERRSKPEDLSMRRVTAWGALGGVGILLLNAVLMLLFEGSLPGDMIPVLVIMGTLGAGCAAGSLALARRAPDPKGTGEAFTPGGSSPDALPGAYVMDGVRSEERQRVAVPLV